VPPQIISAQFAMSISMPTLLFGIKCAQLLPNGLGGVIMITDGLHGMVSADMVPKLGFPAWFPTAVGAFKLSQLAMNWTNDGEFTHIAQLMMAFQLGGATYLHIVVEGKVLAAGSCAVFGILTAAALIIDGTFSPTTSVGLLAICSSLGFGSGYLVSALGNKSVSSKR
jgi:hypothetical protein